MNFVHLIYFSIHKEVYYKSWDFYTAENIFYSSNDLATLLPVTRKRNIIMVMPTITIAATKNDHPLYLMNYTRIVQLLQLHTTGYEQI